MLGLKMPDAPLAQRKRPRTGETDDNTQQLLKLVAKLSLANALAARVLRSIILDVMHIPATSDIVVSILEATRAYAAAHRPASAEARQAMGMPHHHAWNAMLERVKKDAPAGPECKAITEYSDYIKTNPVLLLTTQVRYVRITKCYDKAMKKLEVNCHPDSQSWAVWQVIKKYLLAKGCKELPGVAPQGDLERRIQKAIDETTPDDEMGG